MRGESTLNIEYSPDGKKKNFLLQPIVMHVIDMKPNKCIPFSFRPLAVWALLALNSLNTATATGIIKYNRHYILEQVRPEKGAIYIGRK